jgi:hypothetical protein
MTAIPTSIGRTRVKVRLQNPNPYALEAKFYAVVYFPVTVEYKGKTWYQTSKVATTADGIPTAEYSYYDGDVASHIWLDAHLNVKEE